MNRPKKAAEMYEMDLIGVMNDNIAQLTKGFGIHTQSINGLKAIVDLLLVEVEELRKENKKEKRRWWKW